MWIDNNNKKKREETEEKNQFEAKTSTYTYVVSYSNANNMQHGAHPAIIGISIVCLKAQDRMFLLICPSEGWVFWIQMRFNRAKKLHLCKYSRPKGSFDHLEQIIIISKHSGKIPFVAQSNGIYFSCIILLSIVRIISR